MTKGVRIGISFPVCTIPFTVANCAASADGTAVPHSANGNTVIMPFDGHIVAITAALNADLTAGVVTVKPTVAGTEDADAGVDLDDTHQTNTISDGVNGLTSFSAGDALGVVYDGDASVAPETADLNVLVFVVFDDEGEF